jgi:EAL domain-containing protein (putative c-di-GMP-specific phosphodiesterase class I)
MLASALVGAAIALGATRLRGRARVELRPEGIHCTALMILDGPYGTEAPAIPRGEMLRLSDRIEAALARGLPEGATLERRDIDRFHVDLPDMELGNAAAAIERLRRTASQAHLTVGDDTILSSLSAGLVRRRTGEPPEAVLSRAAQRVALARAFGGDRLVTEDDPEQPPPDALRDAVADAIRDGALRYDMQPIRDLRDGTIVGMEALLRWDRGPYAPNPAPAALADVLERLCDELVDELPRVLEQSAAPVLAEPGRYLSLNITAAVLDERGSAVCDWLATVVDRLPPDRLVVEIVEDAIISRPRRAREVVEAMRARGVRVALDDFGTGLSNLDRLRTLPVDIIKVDQAFIAGLGTSGREETILRHLLAMAGELGMEVVAEGVETDAQVRGLLRIGVHLGQGYHLGRPAPAADWAGRLEALPAPITQS